MAFGCYLTACSLLQAPLPEHLPSSHYRSVSAAKQILFEWFHTARMQNMRSGFGRSRAFGIIVPTTPNPNGLDIGVSL